MRKKILCGVLFASLILAVTGCGDKQDDKPTVESGAESTATETEKAEPAEQPADGDGEAKETSGNALKLPAWLDGELTINGTKIKLPCSYEDIRALGFSVTEADINKYSEIKLPADGKMYVSVFAFQDSGECIGLLFHNASDEEKLLIGECEVYAIQVNTGKDETTGEPATVVMNNGIGSGVTGKADVIAVMGEADHENDVTLTYYVDPKRSQSHGYISFEFDAETGACTDFFYVMPTVEFEY